MGAGAGRTQGLAELLPSQQEALAAGGLGPRKHRPRGGRQGMVGAEPAQPFKAASKLGPLHPSTFFCTSVYLDAGATAKNR